MEFQLYNNNKQYFVNKVLLLSQSVESLRGLSENYSAESGFELPFTNEWLERDYENKEIAEKYHGTRQLRFIDVGDKSIGLRFKDGCKYWSTEELVALEYIIQKVLLLD